MDKSLNHDRAQLEALGSVEKQADEKMEEIFEKVLHGPDTLKILREFKENNAKLKRCRRPHNFIPVDTKRFHGKFVCTHCDGQVSAEAAYWYNQGQTDPR